MAYTFWHDETLPRRKLNDAIFEVDQEPAIEHEEKFIDIVMLMPVIFTLNYRHPDDCVVHFAERLVIPFVGAVIGQLLHINQFKRAMQDVQVSLVGKFFDISF